MKRIPEDTIEKIRNSVDIVDLVGEYVQLKKQGRSFVGLCPFHDEKTPSFSVSPDKQIYHCFGCGSGGNVFSFLMEIEGWEFPEAVKHLGDKAHIEVPDLEPRNQGKKNKGEHQAIISAHDLLVKFYHSCLVKTNAGGEARDYLQKRGFSQETIQAFQIGYAPDEWERAVKFLTKHGFRAEVMQKAGLFSKREFDGKFFDRFRHRIMFPIWDMRGRPIAFGGRVLGDGKPKYLNSPETEVFNKGKTLYAFHLAKPAIREKKQAILFEGYVDVVTAHQAGVKNTVATLGTSLTEEQAYFIRRHAESVVICYDSDNAGVDAAFRAADILGKAGCYVKIATMPNGLDPDDYIGKFGGRRFATDVIGASETVTAFKMRYFRRGKNLQDEGDRLRYIEEVIHVIAGLTRAVERDHYLRQVAEEFSLSLDALKQQQYAAYKQMRQKGINAGEDRNNKALNRRFLQKTLLPASQKAEQMLLAHMMNRVDIADKVQVEWGGSFITDEYDALAAYLYTYYAEGNAADPGRFIQRLPDERLIRAATEIAMIPIHEEVSDQEITDYIHQVQLHQKKLEIEEMEKQKKAVEMQDPHEAARIGNKILEKKREIAHG
ncbi:MAG TPA: DNA primase [Bacillales bacterium]|nr:DNA primase [Bacillales bacterium]